MNRKVIVLFVLVSVCLLLSTPVFAKEKVKIKIGSDVDFGGYITIKLVDSHGKTIKSKGTIHYNITDRYGNYKWAYKPYSEIRLKYDPGMYCVNVKFDGDSHYKSAEKTDIITVYSKNYFDPYTYYDDHNWGLDQQMDDYIEYNYWDEEIYDDASTYDGEGP